MDVAAGGRGPHEVAGGKLGVAKVWEVERAESLQGRESRQGRNKAGRGNTQWLEDDTETWALDWADVSFWRLWVEKEVNTNNNCIPTMRCNHGTGY